MSLGQSKYSLDTAKRQEEVITLLLDELRSDIFALLRKPMDERAMRRAIHKLAMLQGVVEKVYGDRRMDMVGEQLRS